MREGNITQSSSGYFQVATGTAAQRPSAPQNGMMRHNTDNGLMEYYQNGTWTNFLPSTNAATSATKLSSPVMIAHSGDVTGGVAFDGSVAISIPLTLASTGVTAGTYTLTTLTVDAKGRITAASSGTPYTGTTNQTTVSGSNVIGLASDLTAPGTSGWTPPSGTTAQRPSTPGIGQTRYNTDLGRTETWDGSDWIQPIATVNANASIQYANSGIISGAAYTSIEAGGNLWSRQTTTTTVPPSVPTDGFVLFADTRGGATLPAVQAATGMWNRLQQAFSTKRVTLWQAQGGTTTVSAIGGAMLITVGASSTAVTGTAQTNASTNYFTSMRRLRLSTAATAGAIISIRSSGGQQFFRGNGTAGIGGFDLVMHFGVAAVPAATSCRWGAGLFSTTAALTNVDISTLQNMCCFGANAADSNMSFFYNATATTASSVSLGSSFPAKSVSTDFYQARIYTPPNGAFIGYSIINLTTGAQTSGTVATNMPANTAMLCPQIAMITTVATAASIDVQQILIETESY